MTPEEIQALQEENERLKTAAEQANDSVVRLEAKVNELLGETRSAKEAKRAAEAERQRIADEAARNTGDVQHLEASWQEKLSKREAELTGEITNLSSELDRMTVGREALRISTELDHNGSGRLLMPFIAPRLKRELRDGKHVVVVLDKDGKPSASSVEDLIKEFRANPEFAPFVKGSNANGGGASGGGGGAPAAKTKLSEYSDAERIALNRENPALFQQLLAAEKQK